MSIADITESGGNLYKTERKITIDGLKSKNLKIIPKETLLISIFASLGKTTTLKIDASVNQAILGLVAYRKLNKAFLKFYLNYIEYFIAYYSSSNTQENLNLNKIKNLSIVIPPIPEQTAIANYLDRKTTEIDELISQKEQLLKLYDEEKTAIINQAVTKGVPRKDGRSSVSYKDSGIDWLGEIPVHWEVKRMRFLSEIKTGDKDTENREDSGKYPFYVRSQTVERISTYSFDGEAILTAGDGVGVGKVFHYANGKFDYHQRVYRISNFNDIEGKFLFYYMKQNFYKEVIRISAKSTVDSLRLPMLQNFPVCFPQKSEQTAIVQYIEIETNRINSKITKTEKLIELLKEYKTALISEVVTGKLKVI